MAYWQTRLKFHFPSVGRRAALISLVIGLGSWTLFQYTGSSPSGDPLALQQEAPSLRTHRNALEPKRKRTGAFPRVSNSYLQAPQVEMLGLGRQIISDDSDETRAMFAPLRSTHESFFPGSGERSFTFISNPVTGPLRSSDLIYGVAVSGPILRGSAIARDSSRVPLASTQQPNLLTAGRGYIPRKDSAPVVARAARTDSTGIRSAEKAASPKEEESVTKPRSFNRGSFRFELDESGVTTVFLTESAQPTPIARILKTTGVVEQVSLVGTEAPQNWNKFVGELFLIAVAPQLVGRFEGTSFQVESIEPDNLFNLVGLESGDLLASVDGVEMSVFDLEILPDLLLSGSATLVVRAGDRVRVVGISYVPGI